MRSDFVREAILMELVRFVYVMFVFMTPFMKSIGFTVPYSFCLCTYSNVFFFFSLNVSTAKRIY